MKFNLKTSLLSCALSLVVFGASAQMDPLENPAYGKTPEERLETAKKLSFLKDAYDAKLYDDAIIQLKDLLNTAPLASANITSYGINIYRNRIPFAKSQKEKNGMIDTLSMLYDLRAEYYSKTPVNNPMNRPHVILSRKANDYYNYRPQDRSRVRKHFREAIDANVEETEVDLLTNYFKILTDDYAQDSIETEYLLNEYDRVSEVLSRKRDDSLREEGQKRLDAMLVASGAADCENLESIFKPRYAANPNDVDLMKKIASILSRNKCNSDFQMTVTENLYKVDPTPETALVLAMAFENRKEYTKSIQYIREAVAKEKDPKTKSNYLVRAAGSSLAASNYRVAADLAREAISASSSNGIAYLVLGQAYAAGAGSACSDNFSRQTAFWLAVDALSEARRLLSDDNRQVERINGDIAAFRSNFPNKEESFFRALSDGQPYTVDCGWISGRTTVRIKN